MVNNKLTYVALLRGINVGGNTLISMAALRTCFEELGYGNVKTYINSGNVIFNAEAADLRVVERKIEKSITENFGHKIVVVVRSYGEIKELIRRIPKSWRINTDQKCNVIFLRHNIDSRDVLKDLKPKDEIEELHYHPGVLFWSAKTSDLTKSSMIKLASQDIYKQMTIRNFNTTRKIYEIMDKMSTSNT